MNNELKKRMKSLLVIIAATVVITARSADYD